MSTIRLTGGLAALVFFAAGPAAGAQDQQFSFTSSLVIVRGVGENSGGRDEHYGDSSDPDYPTGPFDLGINITGLGMARARGAVGPGVNRAAVEVRGFDPANPAVVLSAGAAVGWYDLVTISDPALNGTAGTFTTTVRVTGSGAFTAPDSWHADVLMAGEWAAVVGVVDGGGAQLQGWGGRWESDEVGFVYAGDPLGAYQSEVTFDFVYGEGFQLGGVLYTDLYADNSGRVPGILDANIDLSNTVTWGGMRGLSANASLTSATGVDWRFAQGAAQSVPEPATAGLAAVAGLCLAGYAGRTRRS